MYIVFALEIVIPNPPPANVESDWALVPDQNGHMYMVNVHEARNRPMPHFSPNTGILFELYTRSNPTERQLLRVNDIDALAASNFNANHPTRFAIHGFRSDDSLAASFRNGI